jgi:phosphoribosylformimino-5-aminoimidazole carboxamide ribotide isomerase
LKYFKRKACQALKQMLIGAYFSANMIQVIPSIAIRKGKVVKMRKGDISSEKSYDENPVDLAKRFEGHGIEVIHLVDLDGAEAGTPKNYHVLESIAGHTDLQIDFTGGVCVDGDLSKAFECGADYVTAASVAVTDPELFASWIVSYGREKITLSADVSDPVTNTIAYRGWQRKSDLTLFNHVQYFNDRGLKYVKSTDVTRDGVLEGPNFKFYQDLVNGFPDLKILASGGVRGIDDIKTFQDMGLFAVIFGKAFYEGVISLQEIEQFIVKNNA